MERKVKKQPIIDVEFRKTRPGRASSGYDVIVVDNEGEAKVTTDVPPVVAAMTAAEEIKRLRREYGEDCKLTICEETDESSSRPHRVGETWEGTI